MKVIVWLAALLNAMEARKDHEAETVLFVQEPVIDHAPPAVLATYPEPEMLTFPFTVTLAALEAKAPRAATLSPPTVDG